MERLTLSRRPKTGDKIECLPAGDGLPVWTTIPLDAKLPMMQNPKGSVILYTTKLGQPKHRCKQEHDFDLRDPNGKYISNEYHPLHDPHLKSYFSKEVMRRHLIKKGFISEDGKVLCSLREFNQYRQYLRHIFFLEIAKERKEELERKGRTLLDDRILLQHKPSRGTVVRRRLQQQREHDAIDLKKNLSLKAERVEKRLKAIREEMIAREQKQREEAERRQLSVYRNQQEAEQRNQMMIKRWRHKDRLRKRVIEDREAQRKIQAEMKCLEKWNERKLSQKIRLDRQALIIQHEDDQRVNSITEREQFVNRQRESLQKKIDTLKERTREHKRKRDELYAKRFEEKLASGDYTKWSRRREKRQKHRRPFNSTWDLKDVLNNLQVSDIKKEGARISPRVAVYKDSPVVRTTGKYKHLQDEELRKKAREIVDGVLEKVKNEIYPAYLRSIGEGYDATLSKSVRFSHEEDEIKQQDISKVAEGGKLRGITISIEDFDAGSRFRPVAEHILTPCASQLEVQKLEAEAILGSPEVGDKTTSVSFVETLLLRLLDDLNSGRLKKEDIMKLASYSMEIIQSTETSTLKDSTILEEIESEGPLPASSSSSMIAKRMVEFTLNRILTDIQSGNVHRDDLASLTVSLVDVSGCGDEGSISLSVSEADLDDYIDETIRTATASALDPREDSPVCEALLDNFMVDTLKRLIKDLEEEALSKEQIESLAKSVKEETKLLKDTSGLELRGIDDIRFVLETLLAQLKSGDFDSQALYQIVFAVVYSYNLILHPPTPSYESKITELLKDVLVTAEEKASTGKVDILNENVVHEATDRLSATSLDIGQIEKLSSSIMKVSAKADVVCKATTSDMAQAIIENVLVKAKAQIEEEQVDKQILEGVQNVAEAVILTLAPQSQSPPLVDVFVEILEFLKDNMDSSESMEETTFREFSDLIQQVKAHRLGPEEVAGMATSVAEIVKELPKSEEAETAFYAVKDTLKSVRDDLRLGNIEDSLINEMIDVVRFAGRTAISSDPKSPGLLSCLTDFIKSVLHLLSAKIQTGEFDQKDLSEISNALQETVAGKSSKTNEKEETFKEGYQIKNEYTEVGDNVVGIPKADNVLNYLSYLIDNMETGGMRSDEIKNLGTKLIEYGKRFIGSISETVLSIDTEDIAEGAVEEVLRILQMEIESGVLTKDSLKDVTKSIIISSSDSQFADKLIGSTFKGIERDLQRGYDVKNIPSIPTIDQSPSASTIASLVVTQTIDEIRKTFTKSGMPKEMIQSVASSLILYLEEKGAEIGTLPAAFEKHRKTIERLVSVLKTDNIKVIEAERLFCLILQRYKDFVQNKESTAQCEIGLSETDSCLIEEIVNETLKNIQRSVESGKLIDKDFSIPSMSRSDTSRVASDVVKLCIDNFKKQQDFDSVNIRPQLTENLIDFIVEIVEKLQIELSNGSISNLSMATFYRSISSDKDDLKALEANAMDNLSFTLFDIETNRSQSVYVQRIIDTYFMEDQYSLDTLVDSTKAVESILVSVSSDILTKFVKTTLENIIMDMRDGNARQKIEKESSSYLLRTTSSIIAENAIKKVIDQVKDDLTSSLIGEGGKLASKANIESAASKVLKDHLKISSKSPKTSQEKLASSSRHSSTISSKGVEDLVLETLHNIVSNLRFEQTMKVQGDKKADDLDSQASEEINDFVLQTLQNIVTDLQDRRSQIDLGVYKTEDSSEGTMNEHMCKDSIHATTYVNEILHSVLEDMRSEMSTRAGASQHEEQNLELISPLQLESSIIDTLIKVLSGTAVHTQESLVEQQQRDNVRMILAESIKQTIVHVKDGRFGQNEIQSMYDSLSKCLDERTRKFIDEEQISNVQNKVLSLLLSLSNKIQNISMTDDMLNKLSSHLGAIGLEVPAENESNLTDGESSSVASSDISELIQTVLSRIKQQLSVENRQTGEMEDANQASATEAKDSGESKVLVIDKNFNRRNSASSSCPSTLNKNNSDTSSTSLDIKLPKRKFDKDEISKSINNREMGNEKIRSTAQQSGMGKLNKNPNNVPHNSSKGNRDARLLNRKVMPKPQIRNKQVNYLTSVVRSGTETEVMKPKKDTPIPSHRTSHRQEKTAYPTPIKESIYSQGSGCTPIRPPEFKPRFTGRQNLRSPDHYRRSPDFTISRTIRHQPEVRPEGPLELKSLCGVHKTRIRYRNTIENQSDSTTDDGSFTSELF